jgi:hypothetical protein
MSTLSVGDRVVLTIEFSGKKIKEWGTGVYIITKAPHIDYTDDGLFELRSEINGRYTKAALYELKCALPLAGEATSTQQWHPVTPVRQEWGQLLKHVSFHF